MTADLPSRRVPRGGAWLIAKASKNSEFRQELLKDPKSAVERELGITLEEDVTVRVLEDTATTQHLVLPLKPKVPPATRLGGELSDTELLDLLRGARTHVGYSFCPNEKDNI
jgi:hypothetical protein